ncbi:WSC domain-containing protein 1-like [Penaeus monodon]|uniref:WSC domain-containing protein 1-like n=1 Tax=Penaeus monodon TaxID=6687 RepID=UPI0018A7C0F1|nr:WSC domain-containing protein 1-like [Penaeus monodon]
MRFPSVSHFFSVLTFVGVLFLTAYIPQDMENVRLIPEALPFPRRVASTDEFVAAGREEQTGIDWKTIPSPLSEPRWPELDHNMATTPLWPADPACAMYNVSFALKVNRTFLVSFPRSGNSWTRYLVEGATGVATGAVFQAETLLFFGMKSNMEKLRGKVILVKIHRNDRRRVPDHAPVILLIRNPAKAIVSFFNYVNGEGEEKWTRNVSYDSYFTKDFSEYFDLQLTKWMKLAKDRLLYSQRLLVIPYEELQEDPMAQVRRALAFLGVPADEGRLACLRRHTEGLMLGLQRQVDPYTSEEKAAMAKAVAEVSELLRERNLPPLPAYDLIHE